MANEFYTLIVVPHAKARFRKIQISVRLTKWMLGPSPAALSVAIVGVLVHYAMIAVEVHELRGCGPRTRSSAPRPRNTRRTRRKLQAKVQQLQIDGDEAGRDGRPRAVAAGGRVRRRRAACPGLEIAGARASSRGRSPRWTASLTSLTDRSAQLEEFYRDQTVLLSSTPSIWPVRGYLSASFGNRIDPFTGQQDFHPGIDISTPIGTSVQAPADGIVISAGRPGRLRERDHHRPRLRRGHALRAPLRLRRAAGPAGPPRRRDRLRRQHRPLDRPPPALRGLGASDQAQNPIHFILDEYRTSARRGRRPPANRRGRQQRPLVCLRPPVIGRGLTGPCRRS